VVAIPAARANVDHGSPAVAAVAAELAVFAGRPGGVFGSGGVEPGFRSLPIPHPGGGRGGPTEPRHARAHSFPRRVLDRRGKGLHHLTRTVDDLTAALARAPGPGWHPVRLNREHPRGPEALLPPREAFGTTDQLAPTGAPGIRRADAVPPSLRFAEPVPEPAGTAPARFDRVEPHAPTMADRPRLHRERLRGEVDGLGDTTPVPPADLVVPGRAGADDREGEPAVGRTGIGALHVTRRGQAPAEGALPARPTGAGAGRHLAWTRTPRRPPGAAIHAPS